ncbi:MAG: aminopeptidase P family N-terminal domain-containing protein, partial [Rhodospirillales bacterium]
MENPDPTAPYQGDANLDRLLKMAGSRFDAAGMRQLLAGLIAAPKAVDPNAWMAIAAETIDPELELQLGAFRAQAEAVILNSGASGEETMESRLQRFRDELKRRKLDGFIVPHSDEHQGEYIALRSERLAWLTGFTGSAGLAVVLGDSAAIFVDGRYTIQAAREADGRLFEFIHLTDDPPAEWIAANLKPKARLGFDPWLHTPDQVKRYRTGCEKAGAELTASKENPVDAVWMDQPPEPVAPVVPHAIVFAGRSSTEKRGQIAAVLRQEKQDSAILSAPDSIAWLLNIRGGDVPYSPLALCFAVIHSDASVELFIDPSKLTPGLGEHLGEGVAVEPPQALAGVLKRMGDQCRRV